MGELKATFFDSPFLLAIRGTSKVKRRRKAFICFWRNLGGEAPKRTFHSLLGICSLVFVVPCWLSGRFDLSFVSFSGPSFSLAILVVCYRLIVILQDKTYVYDINKVKILDAIDTVPNLKGLCGFSPSLDGCFLALPASITKGSVLLYNVMELQSHCEIDAHRAPLAAIVLCSNGMYIATASEQGTIIRVHLVSDATKSYSFRRGTYPSTIFSLSFAPSMQIPDILVATSSSGSLHVFSLGFALNQRSRKSSTILGSIIPDSITDVLDPAHRHVLHSAVTAGVKSNAVIRKVDKVADASTPGIASYKATISIITYNGYFQEYSFRLNYQNEPLWTLEHEFNLLSPVSDNASS